MQPPRENPPVDPGGDQDPGPDRGPNEAIRPPSSGGAAQEPALILQSKDLLQGRREVWIQHGDFPAFVRSEGPLYLGGPMWRIELTGPRWQQAGAAGAAGTEDDR